MRQSWETMTSVSAGHIILTPTQPVGSGRPQRESNPGPPHQESRALLTELPPPPPPPPRGAGGAIIAVLVAFGPRVLGKGSSHVMFHVTFGNNGYPPIGSLSLRYTFDYVQNIYNALFEVESPSVWLRHIVYPS